MSESFHTHATRTMWRCSRFRSPILVSCESCYKRMRSVTKECVLSQMSESWHMCDKNHVEMLKIQIAYFGTVWVMSQRKAFCHQWLVETTWRFSRLPRLLVLCESCLRRMCSVIYMSEWSHIWGMEYVEIFKLQIAYIGDVWVMSHMNEWSCVWMIHVMYGWVTSHMKESCHVWHDSFMSRMVESCHIWRSHFTYEWVMWHMSVSYHIWVSHVT